MPSCFVQHNHQTSLLPLDREQIFRTCVPYLLCLTLIVIRVIHYLRPQSSGFTERFKCRDVPLHLSMTIADSERERLERQDINFSFSRLLVKNIFEDILFPDSNFLSQSVYNV